MKNLRLSENVYTYGTKMVSLDEIVDIIKNDPQLKKTCEAIRNGSLDEGTVFKLKKSLKTVEFNTVTEGKRDVEHIKAVTGYVMLDIDDTGADYNRLKQEVANDKELNPALVYFSPSGKLRVILYVPQMLENTEDPYNVYVSYYEQCCIYMAQKHRVMPDTNCKDAVRLCYLAHDPNPFYNPNAETVLDWSPVFDDDVRETYEYYAGDSEHEIKPGNNGGFDGERYVEWLRQVREDLLTDENGEYLYNKDTKLFVGSRHERTAKTFIGNFGGYSLKYRISVVAMFLYANDRRRAQMFVNKHFEDANHLWNPCGSSHARLVAKGEVHKDVLMWVLKTFGFKSSYELPKTTVSFAEEFTTPNKGAKEKTLAEEWEGIAREHQMPLFFRNIMGDKTVANEYLDLRLYSALATASGFAQNTTVKFNGENCGLNLLLNVVGSSASGKGEMMTMPKTLLKTMNAVFNAFNKTTGEEYKTELAKWNKSKDEQATKPKKPMFLSNNPTLATGNGLLTILEQNNGKMILANTEYSNLVKMEKTQYGGLLSLIKNIWDNDKIDTFSRKELNDRNELVVERPVCGVLLSGVFRQFKELYKDYDDGLLQRSLWYVVPDKEYNLSPLWRDNQGNYKDIEAEFVMWHMHNHFHGGVCYVLCDKDFERLRTETNAFVKKLSETWDTGDEVGGACRSLIYRFAHNVAKVAALLQSFADFETYYAAPNPMSEYDLEEYVQNPACWRRNPLMLDKVRTTKHTFNEYVMEQEGNWDYILDPDKRDMHEDARKRGFAEYVNLDYNWVQAAWKMLTPSLMHGLRMISTYRNDGGVANVNPLKGGVKYVALSMCGQSFETKDYIDALTKIQKKVPNNKTVSVYLKQLDCENQIRKIARGAYIKINGDIAQTAQESDENFNEFDDAMGVEVQ